MIRHLADGSAGVTLGVAGVIVAVTQGGYGAVLIAVTATGAGVGGVAVGGAGGGSNPAPRPLFPR